MGRGSPHRKSPSRRERSPNTRQRSSHRAESPAREKLREQVKPAKKPKRSVSPVPQSLSPRSKRLRRVQEERDGERTQRRDSERGSEKERRPRHGRGGSRSPPSVDREGDKRRVKEYERTDSRGSDRERRSGRDEADQRSGNKRRSRSPQPRPHDEVPNSEGAGNRIEEDDPVSKMEAAEAALAQKEKPSFELSGKLAAETNRVKGVTLLFTEPPDACKPVIRWRLYVFKNGEALNEPLYIHRQSCYLFGRERRVADIPTDHPSCSKQHAVIQYRKVEFEKPDGMLGKEIRPYIMDLGSTNKTFINDGPIEPERYYELREQDTIKFGNSSREYVLLHENSAT